MEGGVAATKRQSQSGTIFYNAKQKLEHEKGLGRDTWEQSRLQHVPQGESAAAFSATTRGGFPGWARYLNPSQLQQRSRPAQHVHDFMPWPWVHVTRLRKRHVKIFRGGSATCTFPNTWTRKFALPN